MRYYLSRIVSLNGLSLAVVLISTSLLVRAQAPFGSTGTPTDQRSALGAVRSQVNWLQNATRTAPNGTQGYGQLWQQFQALREAYIGLTATLNSQQLAKGANDFAELDAGLGIIQEAFTNYQEAITAGQPATSAFHDMCEILREASKIWLQELNKRCSKFKVGWG
jgi:hypothetical protein